MTGDVELTNLTAQKAVELLKLGEIVPSELVDAVAKRIEEVNCHVNALPSLCLDLSLIHISEPTRRTAMS